MLFLRNASLFKSLKRSSSICRFYSKQEVTPKKTCLYDFHVSKGGKMVDFAGWSMPVQYSDLSHVQSHHYTREHASIFDVSHMLQTKVHGKDRVQFIESLTVADALGLKDNQGTLSLFTNRDGGIIDDLIITKTTEGYLYVVSNAGCAEKDFALMECRAEEFRSEGKDVVLEPMNFGLIALQGPEMVAALQPGIDVDLSNLPFMTSTLANVYGVAGCRVTRCGYTGEDGVEISVPEDQTVAVTETLLQSTTADVKMAGLGARDSLRLEAGLCLYGSDINHNTTPIEATLAWTIGKRRREAADFPGAQKILNQLKEKPLRKRVGFVSSGPPARAGTPIFDPEGSRQIGRLTSGCPSPCLKKNVAMGYIETPFSKNGTDVKFEIRKKMIGAVVSKMPFVKCNYFTGK